MISSQNYIISDSFDSWKIFDSIISHTYKYENHKLYVYLSLGTILNLYNDDDNDERPVKLIVYPSGLTITKEGDYIRKNKEFIKLHIIEVDAKSEKIISFRVTQGIVHAFKELGSIIRETSKKRNIDKVYADKAHDNRRSFNLLDHLNIEFAALLHESDTNQLALKT